MALNALQRRIVRLHERAEKVYKGEEIDVRLDRLSCLYHYGYGSPTGNGQATAGYTSEAADHPERIVHVNQVMPRVNTAMASYFARRPDIITKGRRAQDQQAADTAEVLLNYLTRHMQYSPELREWLFWSRLGMYGCLKLGMEQDKAGRRLPMIRAVDPRCVRVDVSSTDRFRPHEGIWQAFKFRRTITGMRNSGLYDGKRLDRLADQIGAREGDGFDEDTTEIWTWENYIRNGKEIVLSVSANGYQTTEFSTEDRVWLREDDWTPVIGLPGRFLYFYPSPKTFYPVSPCEFWLDHQAEINAYRTQKLIHAERSNRRRFYDPNAFGSEAASMLEGNQPRQYIPIPNSNGKLSEAVMEEPMAAVSEDIYKGEFEAEMSITMIDGQGSVQLGNTQQDAGSPSATRDSLVENSLRLRMSQMQEVWEDGLEDVYQSVLNLAQKGMEGELILQITGVMETRMSREEIQGDIDVVLAFASTMPIDREKEWMKAREFVELVSASAALQSQFKPEWLARFIAKANGQIKDVDQALMAPRPAMPGMPPGLPPGMPPDLGGGMPGGPQAPGMDGAPPALGNPSDLNDLALTGTQSGVSPLSLAAQFRGLE